MAYNVGSNNQVNGSSRAGEFLTGNMDFYTVVTLVPCDQTNVVTPVAYLYTQQGYSTWQTVSVVDGTGTSQTYSTQASYTDALTKQDNLNKLIRLFSTRANPVAVSVSTTTLANPHTTTLFSGYSYASVFGTAYATSLTAYVVKFATEKTSTWLVSGSTAGTDSNDVGYQLLDTFQGVSVTDLATPVLATTVFETLSAANTNIIAYRSANI
jgi:hypothetical protein